MGLQRTLHGETVVAWKILIRFSSSLRTSTSIAQRNCHLTDFNKPLVFSEDVNKTVHKSTNLSWQVLMNPFSPQRTHTNSTKKSTNCTEKSTKCTEREIVVTWQVPKTKICPFTNCADKLSSLSCVRVKGTNAVPSEHDVWWWMRYDAAVNAIFSSFFLFSFFSSPASPDRLQLLSITCLYFCRRVDILFCSLFLSFFFFLS